MVGYSKKASPPEGDTDCHALFSSNFNTFMLVVKYELMSTPVEAKRKYVYDLLTVFDDHGFTPPVLEAIEETGNTLAISWGRSIPRDKKFTLEPPERITQLMKEAQRTIANKTSLTIWSVCLTIPMVIFEVDKPINQVGATHEPEYKLIFDLKRNGYCFYERDSPRSIGATTIPILEDLAIFPKSLKEREESSVIAIPTPFMDYRVVPMLAFASHLAKVVEQHPQALANAFLSHSKSGPF